MNNFICVKCKEVLDLNKILYSCVFCDKKLCEDCENYIDGYINYCDTCKQEICKDCSPITACEWLPERKCNDCINKKSTQ